MQIPDHLLPTQFPPSPRVMTQRTIWVKPGTTPEMVLDPDFWVHGSLQVEGRAGGSVLKVGDRLDVLAQDGSFDLDIRVAAVDSRGFWVQMRLLRAWPLELMARLLAKTLPPVKAGVAARTWPDAEGYRIEWAGPHHQFRIIDRVGGVVAKGFGTQEEAIAELDLIKSTKAAAAAA